MDDQPRLTFPLPSDDDDDTIKIYPLSELMKRKPRAVLVEHFLFMKGITTLVAKSGWGKTTTAVSIALSVERSWSEFLCLYKALLICVHCVT
jgi:hypothetical protein